jgi:hypothetical protein
MVEALTTKREEDFTTEHTEITEKRRGEESKIV